MSKVILTLLTKRGCLPCERLKLSLGKLHDEYSFSLNVIDITNNKQYEKFKYEVPVLMFQDEIISKMIYDEKKVLDILNKYALKDE